MVSKYQIDGIRIDTIPEVPKWFWQQFSEAAGVYQVGEVFDGRMDYVSDYQNCCLDATLNYPLFFSLRNAFNYNNSIKDIESTLQNIDKSFHDPSALGVFVNNHDNWRFLSRNGNTKRFQNAVGFSILTNGIPIVYYGDEQYFNGSDDPNNREPLFNFMNSRQSEMYKFISMLVKLRINEQLWNKKQVQRYADDNFYAFTRQNVMALFTNVDGDVYRSITYMDYKEGDKLCNVFNEGDCVYVRQGKIDVKLSGGEMKVYVIKQ